MSIVTLGYDRPWSKRTPTRVLGNTNINEALVNYNKYRAFVYSRLQRIYCDTETKPTVPKPGLFGESDT